MKKYSGLLILTVLAILLISHQETKAQAEHILVPIGGGYSDVYSGLCATIVQHAQDNTVNIIVLPTTYSSNAENISAGERQVNMADAEVRRYEIQEACKRAGPAGLEVTAAIVPVFTHADALLPENTAFFTPQVTAIFILGGDQTVAMRAIANTPIEQAMAKAYERGAVIAGTSAGGGMLASNMLAGYHQNFAAESGMKFGAAEIWNNADLHGLSFSLPNAILDQHFFQRGRLSRLINAILLPEAPHIGIGVDAYTGIHAYNHTRLGDVFGLYVAAILDAETYHAAESVRYVSPDNLLSVRNVLLHLLAKGSASYDLSTRQSSLSPVPERLERDNHFLNLPHGAGQLFLGGSLLTSLPHNPVLAQFEKASGGATGNILVIMAGYKSGTAANVEAKKYLAGLSADHQELFIAADQMEVINIPDGITGILVIGKDQSLLPAAALTPLKEAWLRGTPILLDNAAAVLAGSVYSNHAPTPTEGEEVEAATQRSFLQGRTKFAEGLGFLPATFEPRLVDNNRWGRLFSLAYNHPGQVAFGLTQNTALWLDGETASVLGSGSIFSLDLRFATLALGTNEGFEIANGLLDVFQPGEKLEYEVADTAATFTFAPTPALQTFQAALPTEPTATTSSPASIQESQAVPANSTPEPSQKMPTRIPSSTPVEQSAFSSATPKQLQPTMTADSNPGPSLGFLAPIGGGILIIVWVVFSLVKMLKQKQTTSEE